MSEPAAKYDSRDFDEERLTLLAHKVRLTIRPSLEYMFQQIHTEEPVAENLPAIMSGTIFAVTDMIGHIRFPAAHDAEAMLKHLHQMLDAGWAAAMCGTTEGQA